jgi:dipeptidyl aminopeptidase/acylaminoacyl peptidase
MYLQAPDGRDASRPLHVAPADNGAPDWSRDGRFLVYHGVGWRNREDLWYLALTGDRIVRPFLETTYHKLLPVFSPDGRYVAYQSEEWGRYEVVVRPFPTGKGEWQVSVRGGRYPRWSGRGDELFYVEEVSNTLMAVKADTRSAFRAEPPQKLFTGEQVGAWLVAGVNEPLYTVTTDGQRFVVVQTVAGGMVTPITVVKGWAAEFSDE